MEYHPGNAGRREGRRCGLRACARALSWEMGPLFRLSLLTTTASPAPAWHCPGGTPWHQGCRLLRQCTLLFQCSEPTFNPSQEARLSPLPEQMDPLLGGGTGKTVARMARVAPVLEGQKLPAKAASSPPPIPICLGSRAARMEGRGCSRWGAPRTHLPPAAGG